MVVAPLKAGDEVFGALGTFSRHNDAFDAADVALVRSLAEHAASAMANQRLIEELDRSHRELDRSRSDRRAGRTPSRRCARSPRASPRCATLPRSSRQVVELASRLVRGEGAILDLLDPETGNLRWAYDDGLRPASSPTRNGRSCGYRSGRARPGVAVAEDRVVVAGDDLVVAVPAGAGERDLLRAHRLPLDDRGADHR